MSAIAFLDPGGVTGVAWVYEPKHETVLNRFLDGRYGDVVEFDCKYHELQGAYEVVCYLMDIHERYELSVLGYEDFQLRQFNMKKELLSPVRITELVRAMMWYEFDQYDIKLWDQLEWVPQPSSSMAVMDKERMQRLDLWRPGLKDGNAALRHLVSYLRK